jgi:hypothetical protein
VPDGSPGSSAPLPLASKKALTVDSPEACTGPVAP